MSYYKHVIEPEAGKRVVVITQIKDMAELVNGLERSMCWRVKDENRT